MHNRQRFKLRLYRLLVPFLAVMLAVVSLQGGGKSWAVSAGQPADPARSNWVAYLDITRSGSPSVSCTGSLISPTWVITARHCLERGVTGIKASFGSQRSNPVAAKRWDGSPYGDIGLVELATPAYGVTPIQYAGGLPAINTPAEVFGWGGQRYPLQAAQVAVYSYSKGAREINGSTFSFNLSSGFDVIVARSMTRAVTEKGDSGSALMAWGKVYGVLMGSDSTGQSVYSPTAYMGTWITNVTGVRPDTPLAAAIDYKYAKFEPRISGKDRVDTALNVASSGAFTSNAAVVTTGVVAADALSATSLAGAVSAPVLLSSNTAIEPKIVDYIINQGKKRVYVVGGRSRFAGVDTARLNAAKVTVTELIGANRYDTALQVANETFVQLDKAGAGPRRIFIADGTEFADALTAGAIAGQSKGAVLFSAGTSNTANTINYIQQWAAQRSGSGASIELVAVGGRAAQAMVNAGLTTMGGVTYRPVVGQDRYATAVALAGQYVPNPVGAVVTSGANFPDGLAGGALAIVRKEPLLLSAQEYLPPVTRNYLESNAAKRNTIMVGGVGAITDAVADILGQMRS